ncbi:MAG: hypothetical protein JSV22_05300, partial [Bacteroidales bacterium]
MKALTYLLLVFLIISGCTSTKKLMTRGNYDKVIDKSVKKLIKNPGSEKDAINLDRAYKLANERDLERINYLKIEGNPDTWDEVFRRYSILKSRQEKVKKVLPLNIRGESINYEIIDYNAKIVESKTKAADYYYEHGKKLMENNTKESYRQAYYELRKAGDYTGGSFQDIDNLISKAKYNGISRVLVNSVNNTHLRLSQEFMDNLLSFNSSGLNSEWVEYHLKPLDRSIEYDYYVDINLQIIDVSPEMIHTKDYIEEKTVEDGFEYVLDRRGNVMKDSLGNDIKVKKYKDLTCTIIERLQEKSVNIKGEIEIVSTNPRRLISKEPVAASTYFEHLTARAVGDIEALKPETRKLLENEPVPFPDDFAMIYDCSEA